MIVDQHDMAGKLLDRFVVTYDHERDFFKFVSSIGNCSGVMISANDMLREFASGTRIIYVPSGGEPVNDMITKWSTVMVKRRTRGRRIVDVPCVVTADSYADLCRLEDKIRKAKESTRG